MGARILIVDDHEIVRKGVRSLIKEARPDWEICGETTNGVEAIESVKTLKPNVVIIDFGMPYMNGLEAASRIGELGLGCHVLLFTMHESGILVAEARQAGAKGYVMKSQAGRDLILAVDRVLAGGTFFGNPGGEAERENPTPPRGTVMFCVDFRFCGA